MQMHAKYSNGEVQTKTACAFLILSVPNQLKLRIVLHFPYLLDIDECSLGMHTCTELQLCNNVLGTFGCYCQSGYVFSPDGETCESKHG